MHQFRFVSFLTVFVAVLLLSGCGDSGDKPYKVNTFNMGEKITLGHITYEVFETQWLTQIGAGADARIPEHRFFLVRLSAFNNLSTDTIVPNLSIEDDSGKTYPEQSSGEGVPQYIGYLRTVKENDSAQGNALFDAPPRHYKLKISDETGEKMAYVDIPLTFVSETPDVPDVGGKDKKK
jgi:hypothetical protein